MARSHQTIEVSKSKAGTKRASDIEQHNRRTAGTGGVILWIV
jgi:hypothetical protein